MANQDLQAAQKGKNDEFYTQWEVIEQEINAYLEYDPLVFKGKTILLPCDDPEWSNFTKFFALHFNDFGLKKLISTSYAPNSNAGAVFYQPTLFETEAPQYDERKSKERGRLFTTSKDINNDGTIDIDDLQWSYLEGDGDFRSEEVTRLRDEADIVITNPPFSMFRGFIAWIIEGNKKFSVIGNVNAITYKEVFPLIQKNHLWLGSSIRSGDQEFRVPANYPLRAAGWRVDEEGNRFIRVKGVRWFTNIEHGRRHEPLQLMTMEDNLRFSRHKQVRENGYLKYDNYDAIEVPFVDAIPSDYMEAIGVPITFLDKYNPDQFVLVGADFEVAQPILLNNGKRGTGRFYITRGRERERAFVLTAGHTKEAVMTKLLQEYGYSPEHLSYRSGIMGVPITFLDKYNPDQFEILGSQRWSKSRAY